MLQALVFLCLNLQLTDGKFCNQRAKNISRVHDLVPIRANSGYSEKWTNKNPSIGDEGNWAVEKYESMEMKASCTRKKFDGICILKSFWFTNPLFQRPITLWNRNVCGTESPLASSSRKGKKSRFAVMFISRKLVYVNWWETAQHIHCSNIQAIIWSSSS